MLPQQIPHRMLVAISLPQKAMDTNVKHTYFRNFNLPPFLIQWLLYIESAIFGSGGIHK